MEAKVTKYGREMLCKAHAGDTQLKPITHISLGNGGISEGIPVTVTGNETALKNEIIKKAAESHQYLEEEDASTGEVKAKMRYMVSLGKTELVNEKISEAGLIDADGGLVAYLTFLEKGKDEGMTFQFHIDEIF